MRDMLERDSNSQITEPVKRVKGLPENKQCLKYPGFECNCRLKDEVIRRNTLKKLRQDLGIYTFDDIFSNIFTDPDLVQTHGTKRRELCEGRPPSFLEKLKAFRIRIV